MAKVDSLSHTHLVLNKSTGTALQPLADQDPSSDELETHTRRHARTQGTRGQKDKQTDTQTHRTRGDAVNVEAGSPGR